MAEPYPLNPRPRLAAFTADAAPRISPIVFAGFVRIGEVSLLLALGFLIAAFYVNEKDLNATSQYLAALCFTGVVMLTALQLLGLYTIPNFLAYLRNLPRVAVAWTIAIAMLMASIFFFKVGPEFSRVWVATWYLSGLIALAAFRALVTSFTRGGIQNGRLTRRAVIYGAGPACEALIKSLEADTQGDIRICGIFDDRGDQRVGQTVAGYPKLGNIDELLAFSRRTRVDLLLVALPLAAENRVAALLRRLWVLPIDIRLAPATSKLKLRPRAYSYIGAVPVLDLIDKPIADWDVVSKWLFDKIVGMLAIGVLAPVMALVALAIKLDSRGPVIFRQKRFGFNNELIEVYKFRSMYTDRTDAAASKLVTKDDPRVTRVGRIIRKTSLDELPQLFNVLKGDLSLVGPRPHAVKAKAADTLYDEAVDGYFARHKVKPGITGWAQINGWRGETDTLEKIQKRVDFDIQYIDNWSVMFDLYILVRTPIALLKTENAY
jgi:Undecaprenyl-phosphate glucose phosphotransferase